MMNVNLIEDDVCTPAVECAKSLQAEIFLQGPQSGGCSDRWLSCSPPDRQEFSWIVTNDRAGLSSWRTRAGEWVPHLFVPFFGV